MKSRMRTAGRLRRGILVVLIPLAMASCGSESDEEVIPTGGDTSASVDGSVTTSTSDSGISAQDVDGADPEKVLLAAILLGVGDIDVALAEGLVTADEVDLAVAALQTGTLTEWSDRATGGG